MMFEECAVYYYFSKQCPFIHSTSIQCLLGLVHSWDTVVNKTELPALLELLVVMALKKTPGLL